MGFILINFVLIYNKRFMKIWHENKIFNLSLNSVWIITLDLVLNIITLYPKKFVVIVDYKQFQNVSTANNNSGTPNKSH